MKSNTVFLAVGAIVVAVVLGLFFFSSRAPTGPAEGVSDNVFFTAQNVRTILPSSLPAGWRLDAVEEKGAGTWAGLISKQDKTIEVRYVNPDAKALQVSRETGERTEVPQEAILYFFPDLWSEKEIADYAARITSPESMIRAVSYPSYMGQTRSYRIMYLSGDEEFIQYLKSSIKE